MFNSSSVNFNRKMLIMAANHSSTIFHNWQKEYGGLGHLYSPFYFCGKEKKLKTKTWKPLENVPFALDNGKFICYTHQINWNQDLFIAHCDRIFDSNHKPLFIVVPDEVGDKYKTLQNWDIWANRLRRYRTPLALAVQDGMQPKDLKNLNDFNSEKDFIFIGGTTDWKLNTLREWTKHFSNVHCGRVNTWRRLVQCYDAGCYSVDGTGWFRGDKKQTNELKTFLSLQAMPHLITANQLSLAL